MLSFKIGIMWKLPPDNKQELVNHIKTLIDIKGFSKNACLILTVRKWYS